MADAHTFLAALTTVLCVAAVSTVLFQRLKQPVVLGYLLAGLIVGPHVPVPLVADPGVVQTLSELGVILLMFSLGLEFSLKELVRVAPTSGVTALIQCSLMVWLGFVTGRLFGWTSLESLFAGACIAISSTTIIAKAFDEQGIRGRLRELVVGILIVEDLVAVLLMAALTALASGNGLSAAALASTVGKLAAFLVALVVVGLLVVPRIVRAVVRLERSETTIVTSIGLCFAVALLAQYFGYSVALGAFLAGSLVSESGEGKRIEHLIQPVRDVFAAIFFVSVGMLIDPRLVAENWGAVVVFTLVVIAGKLVSVSLGAFLTGAGTRTSVQAGMSLAQIGEFSFIIASLGQALGATRPFLYPVAVAVSAVTTLTTPWLIRGAGAASQFVDRKLPRPLQTFAALYGTWIEALGTHSAGTGTPAQARRMALRLGVDALLLAGIVIGSSWSIGRLAAALRDVTNVGTGLAKAGIVAATVVLAAPFCVGIVRLSRRLGQLLAEAAFPPAAAGKTDLAAAPRRALVVGIQLVTVLFVGGPLLAITQPFVRGVGGAAVLFAVLIVLGAAFWRSATNLQGHVRAGTEMVVEAVAAGMATGEHAEDDGELVRRLLPGIGDPVTFRVLAGSAAAGKSLAELNLRGRTGATVLVVVRGEDAIRMPGAREVLAAGDVLAMAGTREAIESAKGVLGG